MNAHRRREDDILRIPGFFGRLVVNSETSVTGGITKLRASQLEVFRELDGIDRLILNTPTGWGKTTLLTFLAVGRLRSDPRAKGVITVPQRVIGKNFTRRLEVELPDGHRDSWRVLDLCENTPGKVRRLIAWLLTPAEKLDRRVVVTTHASLVAAFSRVGDFPSAFSHTIVIIDEGHHVQSGT